MNSDVKDIIVLFCVGVCIFLVTLNFIFPYTVIVFKICLYLVSLAFFIFAFMTFRDYRKNKNKKQ